MVNGSSEAETKTGKVVQSALDQLDRALGVHALVLATYKDGSGEIKISEYEPSQFNSADLTYTKF